MPSTDDSGAMKGAGVERWASSLKGGGAKLAVFQIVYSGKRKRWTAKEISGALGGRISAKRVTEAGKKLDAEGLVHQVAGVWPVVYEKLANVHYKKARILALLNSTARSAGLPSEKRRRPSPVKAAPSRGTRSPLVKRRSSTKAVLMNDEVNQGKRIVEGIIVQMCRERGVQISEGIDWHYDSDRMTFWLRFGVDGQEKNWNLSYEKVTDAVNDKSVRLEIERGLAMYVIPGTAGAPSAGSSFESEKAAPRLDVFLSHASEDKGFVDPLAKALKDAGISVWYDKNSMSWGDDLRSSIDKGLANSRYGIVVFSKAFLKKKHWTEHELNGLFARERLGKKVILPIWHDISAEDLLTYSPAFADRLAKRSASDSIEDIVASLKDLLGS